MDALVLDTDVVSFFAKADRSLPTGGVWAGRSTAAMPGSPPPRSVMTPHS
jgi:hypothetical protein